MICLFLSLCIEAYTILLAYKSYLLWILSIFEIKYNIYVGKFSISTNYF